MQSLRKWPVMKNYFNLGLGCGLFMPLTKNKVAQMENYDQKFYLPLKNLFISLQDNLLILANLPHN